jgi:hypothetical protein
MRQNTPFEERYFYAQISKVTAAIDGIEHVNVVDWLLNG